MSEPKRVHFETLATGIGSGSISKKSSAAEKTLRLDLTLFEPNVDSFPQFNYKYLCQIERKKKQKANDPRPNGFDQEVENLAREFERKYGNAYAGNGVRTMNNTPSDKNTGYNENNGFIDDSEAFDEMIPDEMDTDRGGFYINSGQLHYKKDPHFERPEDAERMPKPRKRSISSSSGGNESGDSGSYKNGPVDKKAKLYKEKNKCIKKPETLKIKDKSDGGASDSGREGSKKVEKTTSVRNMLQAQRDRQRVNAESGGKLSAQVATTTTEDSSSSDDSSDSSMDDDDEAIDDDEIEEATVVHAQVDVRNTISLSTGTDNEIINLAQSKGNEPMDVDTTKQPPNQTNGNSAAIIIPKEVADLPGKLSPNLLSIINSVKDIGKSTVDKKEFLQRSFRMLVDIDMLAQKELLKADKQKIWKHFEAELPDVFKRQTIMTKLKTHRNKQQAETCNKIEQSSLQLEDQLKKVVNDAMPPLLDRHRLEAARIEKLNKDAMADAVSKGLSKPEHYHKSPSKKFQWNEQSRAIVKDLLSFRQQIFKLERPREQSEEDYTKAYIRSKLVPIWPDGWMKCSSIQSEFLKNGLGKTKENKKPANASKSADQATHPTPAASSAVKGHKLTADSVVTHNNNIVKTKFADDAKQKLDALYNSFSSVSSASSNYASALTIKPSDGASLLTKPIPNVPNSHNTQVTVTTIASHNAIPPPANNISASNIIKKSIPNSNVNGNAINFSRHTEYSSPNDFSPTKKASDHSISQIILYPSSNHSSTVSSIKHQQQSIVHPVHVADNSSITQSSSSSPQTTSTKAPPISHQIKPPKVAGPIKASHLPTNGSSSNRESLLQPPPRLSTSKVIAIDSDSDDESDVEIVAEGVLSPEKRKKHKHKHSKKNKAEISGLNRLGANATGGSTSKEATDPLAISTENDFDKIFSSINDLKELSASNNSRKSYETQFDNQSDSKPHYNHYRVSSPSYDRKQDQYF